MTYSKVVRYIISVKDGRAFSRKEGDSRTAIFGWVVEKIMTIFIPNEIKSPSRRELHTRILEESTKQKITIMMRSESVRIRSFIPAAAAAAARVHALPTHLLQFLLAASPDEHVTIPKLCRFFLIFLRKERFRCGASRAVARENEAESGKSELNTVCFLLWISKLRS